MITFSRWRGHLTGWGILFSGILIALCYGFALQLPFFFDDLPVLTWLGGHSLLDIWTTSSENAYYRPLAFTIYQFGRMFPFGVQQVILHAANLVLHWINAVLVMQLVRLCSRDPAAHIRALLALGLFAVFPFLFRAIPWVTALPHPLVTMLILVAAYAALRAERDNAPRWWGLSLLATALAPFAHESGLVCGAIVGGLVLLQKHSPGGSLQLLRVRSSRALTGIVAGGLLNVGAVLLRSRIPGSGGFLPDGLNSLFDNIMFWLHGLVYPVGPLIGWLVHRHGGYDYGWILAASGFLGLLLIGLGIRGRNGRWILGSLWWSLWGALPVLVRFRYGGLVNSPRFYALAAVGIVTLWAGLIVELGNLVRPAWGRRLVWGVLGGAILVSNLVFLYQQQRVYLSLVHVYQQILQAADEPQNAPLGLVNIPAWLAPKDQTYPLTKDGAVMLPLYTNVREFIGVNREPRPAENVMFGPVLQEPEHAYWGFHGDWLDVGGMREFAARQATLWLARYEQERFELYPVGALAEGQQPSDAQPVALFQGGPVLESASAERVEGEQWAITLTWFATGPAQGDIFVHVVDANRRLVTQADGAALGGMLPLWAWKSGDRIRDIRHVTLPEEGGPYTVLVGLYDERARFPAFVQNVRQPDDAVPAVDIVP